MLCYFDQYVNTLKYRHILTGNEWGIIWQIFATDWWIGDAVWNVGTIYTFSSALQIQHSTRDSSIPSTCKGNHSLSCALSHLIVSWICTNCLLSFVSLFYKMRVILPT